MLVRSHSESPFSVLATQGPCCHSCWWLPTKCFGRREARSSREDVIFVSHMPPKFFMVREQLMSPCFSPLHIGDPEALAYGGWNSQGKLPRVRGSFSGAGVFRGEEVGTICVSELLWIDTDLPRLSSVRAGGHPPLPPGWTPQTWKFKQWLHSTTNLGHVSTAPSPFSV